MILPDVRGLHPFFEELALRFAEAGVDAIAVDYFSRTAGTGRRGTDFDYASHVPQTRHETLNADIAAAAAHLRSADGGAVERLYTVGFCFGGRLSYLQAASGLDAAGVIGFYGPPVGPNRAGLPAPADEAPRFTCPVLAIWGGADQGIGPEAVEAFDQAMDRAGRDPSDGHLSGCAPLILRSDVGRACGSLGRCLASDARVHGPRLSRPPTRRSLRADSW